jgi:allantoinase
MTNPDLIVRGRRLILPGGVAAGSIHIKNGRILQVAQYDDVTPGCELVEVEDEAVVMPGLVDTHVHVNEPGRADWEGFTTATRAAAAGGVTTIVDMPLNSVPATTTLRGFAEKLAHAHGKCSVDVAFWGGVVPGNTWEIAPLAAAGVVGFKCFLIDSGVAEFPSVNESALREAIPELNRVNKVLIVHAELPGPINETTREGAADSPTKYQTFLRSRPRKAEDEAVSLMIGLAEEFGARIHIVHHSSADSLPALRDAINRNVRISAETCPHYLYFAAEEIPDSATEFKCCPPIRERANREQLWKALTAGTIEMVVSDHSPCPPALKLPEVGDFMGAWGGISSLQLRLPVVWTEARRRNHGLEDLTEWLCKAPARLAGLDQRKGQIAPGYDADLVVWRPDEEQLVTAGEIHHRHKVTPYLGQALMGTVQQTFLRGQKIYDEGRFLSQPQGRFILN